MTDSRRKANLLADLRVMINNKKLNPEFWNVCIKCKDGQEIYASAMWLMIRSATLKSLINNSPSWGSKKTISLSDYNVTSSAFLPILEFLYTGDIVQYSPFSSKKAEEIKQASKKLKLPEVEEIVTKFLDRVSASHVKENVANAALKLSVALEEPGTHAHTSTATLVQILSAADLKPIHLRDLSEKAFTHYLKQTDPKGPLFKESTESPSYREFIRFRQVILWCVTQICPDEAAEVVAKALLEVKSSQAGETARKNGFLKSLLTKRKESEDLMKRLLSLVHYERIQVNLLNEVVEPLNVVPEKHITDAYRFLARKDPRLQYTWEHGSSYRTSGNGLVIAKAKPEVGFARFSMPVHRNYGRYEWTIIVEEWCDGFCEIGIFNVDGLQKSEFTGSTLAKQPAGTGRAIRNDYNGNGERTRINQHGRHDDGWSTFKYNLGGTKNPRVKVRLDMDRRVCALAVNGHEHVEAWRNLPFSSAYYPAVSLGDGTKGKVRIELGEGFPKLGDHHF